MGAARERMVESQGEKGAWIQEGGATTKFCIELFRTLSECVDQAKSGHQLLGVVNHCVHGLSSLNDSRIQSSKLHQDAR